MPTMEETIGVHKPPPVFSLLQETLSQKRDQCEALQAELNLTNTFIEELQSRIGKLYERNNSLHVENARQQSRAEEARVVSIALGVTLSVTVLVLAATYVILYLSSCPGGG